jgi:argininosuccinate lyase
VDQVLLALTALQGLLTTADFDLQRMQKAADVPHGAATDLAEYLVATGMPFRDAHVVVGGLVRDAIERRVPLADLVQAHPDLGEEAAALLEPGVAVGRRTTRGGAGPAAVAQQLARYKEDLVKDQQRI